MYFFSFIAIGSISLMIYNNNNNNGPRSGVVGVVGGEGVVPAQWFGTEVVVL